MAPVSLLGTSQTQGNNSLQEWDLGPWALEDGCRLGTPGQPYVTNTTHLTGLENASLHFIPKT